MKTWWETLFGSTTLIEGGIDMINNAFYTDQERAERKIKLMDAFTPFKLIQRFLAMVVTSVFLFVLLVELILVIIGIWYGEALETVGIINTLDMVSMLGWSFVAVISLYFTGGVINTFTSIKK